MSADLSQIGQAICSSLLALVPSILTFVGKETTKQFNHGKSWRLELEFPNGHDTRNR
jgi:hypothetical protein